MGIYLYNLSGLYASPTLLKGWNPLGLE